jgi:hypothetical protein
MRPMHQHDARRRAPHRTAHAVQYLRRLSAQLTGLVMRRATCYSKTSRNISLNLIWESQILKCGICDMLRAMEPLPHPPGSFWSGVAPGAATIAIEADSMGPGGTPSG